MVRAGSTGSLCAVLPREPGLRDASQRQQHHCERHPGDECIQHNHHQQFHDDYEHHVCEPERARGGDGGSAAGVRECAAGGESIGHGERTANRHHVRKCASFRGSNASERVGCQGYQRGSRGGASGSDNEPAGRCQEDAASTADSFCETATGVGRASRTTVSEKRSADTASGCQCGCAADGEGCACRETGDGERGTSGPEYPAARTTCTGESAHESAGNSTCSGRTARCGCAGSTESGTRRTAEPYGTSAAS